MKRLALWLALVPAAIAAGDPASWVPIRWEGGPVEVARRSASASQIRDAISEWYDPSTLDLLDGTPINCLLVTLSAGLDPEVENRQLQLVKEYSRRAHERGIAVLGIAYKGAAPERIVSSVAEARLEGVVLEGDVPGFHSPVPVIRIAAAHVIREGPIAAVEGVPPGVGKANDTAVGSATGGVWIDSNMWLARAFRAGLDRPVWISHEARGSKSIADAAAAGARWIVSLEDDFRAKLVRRESQAMTEWRDMMSELAWFEARKEWREFVPFGNVGIVLGTDADEFLNLVARRQIPYRVIDRRDLSADSLAGLHAVLAFDPPTESERKVLSAFAAHGGLVLTGPSWGGAPKQQSYTVLAEREGEIAVYKDRSPDPEAVARDLNDLVPTEQFGVSVFNAPSAISYVSATADGKRLLIRLVNYATAPAESVQIWAAGKFQSARLEAPGQPVVELPLKRSGSRTETTIPKLATFGAVLLE